MREFRSILNASDVTDAHVEEAVALRSGEYGGDPFSWSEVIDRLERDTDDDWGSSMDTPAIRELKRRVRQVTKDV